MAANLPPASRVLQTHCHSTGVPRFATFAAMLESKPCVVLVATDASCLVPLCGVSTLERLLRILQRLGFGHVTIAAAEPERLRNALTPRSWASAEIEADVQPITVEINSRPLLQIPAELYCDTRLLRALAGSGTTTELIDSSPLPFGSHDSGAILIADSSSSTALDAAEQPRYVRSMRREIRPVFFRVPPPHLRHAAERIIFDTAQNGTLDLPGWAESPIENLILRWLCRTPVTPNQITFIGIAVALGAAALFAAGHLAAGILVALTIGVIDGLDGKQARVKIETTETGKLEHVLDFFVETAMWASLAFWFERSGQLASAWLMFGAIVGSGIWDQLARRYAQGRIDRALDDYTAFDRFVRRIGARRGIYLWSLALGIALGVAARTYVFCAIWGCLTAAVHSVRAIMLKSS